MTFTFGDNVPTVQRGKGRKSLLFKEQKQKRLRWVLGLSHVTTGTPHYYLPTTPNLVIVKGFIPWKTHEPSYNPAIC